MERGVGQQEEETDTRRRRNNIHGRRCCRRRPRVSERSPAKQRPSASVDALCRWVVPRRDSSGRSLVRRSRHSISIFWWSW